jgi:hypothetical protein
MAALVVFLVALHGLRLAPLRLISSSDQLTLLSWGPVVGGLFAALLGTMSATSEFRHGTIRPTFLATPRRPSVIIGKVCVCLLAGFILGLVANALAVGVALGALADRGLSLSLGGSDLTLLVLGGAGGSALMAVFGLGVGALVRNQVVAVVTIAAWFLLVERIVIGLVSDVGRFTPGGAGNALAGAAMSGQDPGSLLSPVVAALVLIGWAAVATAAAIVATARRDVS